MIEVCSLIMTVLVPTAVISAEWCGEDLPPHDEIAPVVAEVEPELGPPQDDLPQFPYEGVAPEPEPEPEPVEAPPPPQEPEPTPEPAPVETSRSVWDKLADCESGNWIDGGASFETGSARWNWAKPGTSVPPWGTTIHHGGLQFHPGTWAAFRSDHHPTYAYDASREQQIEVAERVLAAQGWGAWPTCARKLGLR